MTLTVEKLIYAAYRIAGVLQGPGQTYSPDDANDGLMMLNAMLNAWKAHRLFVWAILRNVFVTVPNQQVYTIGNDPGDPADWTLTRPEHIEAAGWLQNSGSPVVEIPMELITPQTWQYESLKDMESSMSTGLYYRPLLPNGEITLWPKPTEALSVALYTWQSVEQFNETTDQVQLPPAYQEAIEYNLAIRAAVRYRTTLTNDARNIAADSMTRAKALNTPDLRTRVERGAHGFEIHSGRYNIFTNRPY